MIYLDLFLGFLRVGCFAFGGAYGAIPLIREVVLDYGWMTDDMLSYMIAVSESSPGPIMVNLATYVGSNQGGFFGAVLATFAVVTPAFLVIILVMSLLKHFLKNAFVQAALNGLKPCIIGIILATGIDMTIRSVFPLQTAPAMDVRSILVAVLLAVILFGSKPILKKKPSPILLILIAAVLGVLVFGFLQPHG